MKVITRASTLVLGVALSACAWLYAQQSGSGLPGGATNSTQVKVSATAFGGVGPGTSGQVLTSNGAGSPPSFEDSAGGGCAPAGDADELLLDDGAGGCSNVSGLGTATQVLTSNGAGMAPTWEDAGTGGVTQTTGTFTATWNTGFAVAPTNDWSWTKTGNVVTLTAQTIVTQTSNAAGFSTGAGGLPAAIRPATIRYFNGIHATDNGSSNAVGCISLGSDGNMIMRKSTSGTADCAANTWTASGSKQLRVDGGTTSFTYEVSP
jgi:hypothetical protein